MLMDADIADIETNSQDMHHTRRSVEFSPETQVQRLARHQGTGSTFQDDEAPRGELSGPPLGSKAALLTCMACKVIFAAPPPPPPRRSPPSVVFVRQTLDLRALPAVGCSPNEDAGSTGALPANLPLIAAAKPGPQLPAPRAGGRGGRGGGGGG